MKKNLNILAIIPARGGSKRLPGKNIKPLCGKPLIYYVISAAKKSKLVNRVIVSTDYEEIAKVAEKCGAEVPFLRPARLATDRAKTISALLHAVKFMEKKEKTLFDIIVLLQLTTPFTTSEDIDSAIRTLIKTKTKSCVSVCPISERPEWMYKVRGMRAKPLLNLKKQSEASHFLSKAYRLNGAVYAIRRETLINERKIFDNSNISVIIMPRERSCDIDEPIDFEIAKVISRHIKNDKKNTNRK